VSRPMACMLCVLAERVKLPKAPVGASTDDMSQRLEEAVQRAFTGYYTSVNENHGIKEQNVWALFGPLGVPNDVLGGTLLPDLESYGKHRGAHAHQSMAQAVVSVLDPETEFNRVKQIAAQLKPLDAWVSAQKRALR